MALPGSSGPVHCAARAVRRPRQHRRIGLFGGTFDPPHVGHLVTAVNVRHALTSIVVDPDGGQRAVAEGGQPADHAGRGPPGDGRGGGRRRPRAGGRATRDRPGGPSYTADTLAALAEREPGAELFTIVGDDAAAGLTTWERYEEVVARSHDGRRRPPGRAGRAARRRRLDPRRGAPPRGVEHRPAGPVHRRPPARLPGHRPGARRDRRARPLPGGTA